MEHSAASLLHPQRWTLSLCLTRAARQPLERTARQSGRRVNIYLMPVVCVFYYDFMHLWELMSDWLLQVINSINWPSTAWMSILFCVTLTKSSMKFRPTTLERVWEAVWPLVKLLPLPRVPAEAVETIGPADVSYRLFKRLLDLADKGSYFILSAPWPSFEI